MMVIRDTVQYTVAVCSDNVDTVQLFKKKEEWEGIQEENNNAAFLTQLVMVSKGYFFKADAEERKDKGNTRLLS